MKYIFWKPIKYQYFLKYFMEFSTYTFNAVDSSMAASKPKFNSSISDRQIIKRQIAICGKIPHIDDSIGRRLTRTHGPWKVMQLQQLFQLGTVLPEYSNKKNIFLEKSIVKLVL